MPARARPSRSRARGSSPIRVDAHGLDVETGSRPARASAPRLRHTGAPVPDRRRAAACASLALLAWARRLGACIVEDDYDSEYRYGGAPIESLQGLDDAGRVFYVGSFSKILAPALRLGYLVVPARAGARLRAREDGRRPRLGELRPACARRFHRRRPPRGASPALTPAACAPACRLARRRSASTSVTASRSSAAPPACTSCWCCARIARPRSPPSCGARGRLRCRRVLDATALYLRRPRRAELLLGHGALSEREIATGIARLAEVLGGASRA